MPGWERPAGLVYEEINKQAVEEGKDPAAVEALRVRQRSAGEDEEANLRLLADLQALPIRPDFPFVEPSSWEAIEQERPAGTARSTPAVGPGLADRLHGAWLGRCIGCALGKPFEGMGMRGVEGVGLGMDHGGAEARGGRLRPWLRLKRYLSAIDPGEWPLRGYVPGESPAAADPDVGRVICPASTRERIAFMETDDDIRYTVLGLEVLRTRGLAFSTWDVALGWMRHLAYTQACTAETQAYHNLVARYEFHAGSDFGRRPPDVDWSWVATHRNPYREWIGAQIRVDAYGYACPGRPDLAAELAWRDARLSHVKNGIYGAMYCAALIAASCAETDLESLVRVAVAQIPARSRLAAAVHTALQISRAVGARFASFEAALDRLHAAFESYSTVHTIPNAALCTLAVLLSEGDFEQGVTLAVMGGWDTDCNGATVGSILGARVGAAAIPGRWKDPLNDTLRSGIIEYHPISIAECARRSLEVARALV